jgi:ribonuclease HI
MSFYAVRVGRLPGIYDSWQKAFEQVNGFKGALYQKFSSEMDAHNFIAPQAKQKIIIKLRNPCEQPKLPKLPKLVDISSVMNGYFQHNDYCSLPLHSSIVAYTDGSARDNGGTGGTGAKIGYGVFFANPEFDSISETLTSGKLTNNVAELYAIHDAIETAMDKVTPDITNMEIYTDSQYSIGVVTGATTPKTNFEQIQDIRSLLQIVPFKINFTYIAAHTTHASLHHVGNRVADLLAGKASSIA